MVVAITNPDPQLLLPPLLASLPTSFASPRPPPDFLTLLSPILRQRLQIHTSSRSSSHDSWLRLLCWDSAKANVLKDQVEEAHFEPHPVSGELEVGDIESITYKKFDEETLKAQISLSEWNLTAMYLWCPQDENGAGWKLAELLPLDLDLCKDHTWSQSIQDANQSLESTLAQARVQAASAASRKLSVPGNEDDYWAMYDSTPGRTPARQGSINPPAANASEDDYYARYAEVQPAMDNHDPDEEYEEAGQSGLNGNALQEMLSRSTRREQETESHSPLHTTRPDTEALTIPGHEDGVHVNQPVPSSPSSRAGSDTVARLESSAERHASAEIGIRQHISTTVKSMYRLAKSAGMTRDEFDEMVQRELETLSIFDHDD